MNMFAPVRNFLTTTPFGPIVVALLILLIALLVIVPLVIKLRRKSIKNKETRSIMKDLLTWRHLAQLVKGGDDHNKAKQELSDNIVRINELLKQGFGHAAKNTQNLYSVPWYAIVGEPRSGKSTLLSASDLELAPSTEEYNPEDDPKSSLPLRLWTGARAVVYDISGKVFFDRWLDGSSAEWSYIVRQICRRRRRKALDGVIVTIPADALMADDDNLSSKKAILMANELSKLLQQSGMTLPCYVVITKLDMVSGFQEYARAFTGDLRHQIIGYESDSALFSENEFKKFWENLYERLRSGAKQLIFSDGSVRGNRMDRAGKVYLFPDNVAGLYRNLKTYLEILFGENHFHGTQNTFFEGVYFTSAKDLGFSFSPNIAALAKRHTEDVLIPVFDPSPSAGAEGEGGAEEDRLARFNDSSSTALIAVNSTRTLIAPYLEKAKLLQGYFIRDLLHRRIFAPSPHARFVRAEAIRRHIPHFALCALMVSIGAHLLFTALFNADIVRVSLIQSEFYYEWLDGFLQKGSHLRSPLIKEDSNQRFVLDNDPISGDTLSSRVQFYYNAQTYRDTKIPTPLGFKLSEALVFMFDRNMGYREKAFIANQLHKAMIRIPVIKNVGKKLTERVDIETLDTDTREVIVSFVSLDKVQGVDFYKFFSASRFKLDSMIRYLMPELSNDTTELLNTYKSGYDKPNVFQMDIDYMYSQDYREAKQAAIETILSAWERRAVYPDSIYGKLRTLMAISEEITVNFTDVTGALGRIHHVSAFPGVEEAIFEWKQLTDKHKTLAAQGRAVFEEVRLLLRAAHIPLAFENTLPAVNPAQIKGRVGAGNLAGDLFKKPVLDAFGNNLINNYLFNDLVVSYAVREYTRLFDADMDFVKQETKDRENGVMGKIISEQNTFSGDLNREVEDLRARARILQDNALLSQKLDEKTDSPSLFMVYERILLLASDIPLPRRETFQNVKFETSWQRGQNNIKTALDAFEVFVKPYIENEKVSVLIANARVMLLAEAYYNRYVIFTTSLSFLDTFAGNIARVIESRSDTPNLFSFSDTAIQGLFGGFYYNRSYDPQELKYILDDVSSFLSLFKTGEDAKNQPLFLQNVDKRLFQPQAFMDYLENYIAYWGNYPEKAYVSAGTWERFKARAAEYKSFQINSVLLSLYAKSIEALANIDNALVNEYLAASKTKYTASLGDRLSLLNQFLSVPTEKMFTVWTALPADPLEAYTVLRKESEEDLKNTYLAVYTGPDSIGIGWWNSFAIDGVSLLARHADSVYMATLIDNMNRYKAYPLCDDSSLGRLSLTTIQEITALLEAMGAGFSARDDQDPVKTALRHTLFSGSPVQGWADTLYHIAGIIAGAQKPLAWTISQPSVAIQNQLGGSGERLLAINRFRYIEAVKGGSNKRMSSTYMNDKETLLQGNADDSGLVFQFYKTSRDAEPAVVVELKNQWFIFELYLRLDRIVGDKGNVYIPLYLEDEAGKYVYYIEVEFNEELPRPSSWYSSGNWPDIMIADGMIRERH